MALPKQNRLGSSRDFARVHRRGKRASTAHLALRALNLSRPKKTVKKNRLTLSEPHMAGEGSTSGRAVSRKTLNRESVEGSPSTLSSAFGISISRKVSKRAVVRNRIKRQLKAIIQRNLSDIAPGWQVVIVVRPAAVECTFDDFLRELEELLIKLKILNQKAR